PGDERRRRRHPVGRPRLPARGRYPCPPAHPQPRARRTRPRCVPPPRTGDTRRQREPDVNTDGSIDKWLIFDGQDGSLLVGCPSALGCARALDDLWGRDGWEAFTLDDEDLTTPIDRPKKGHQAPFEARVIDP